MLVLVEQDDDDDDAGAWFFTKIMLRSPSVPNLSTDLSSKAPFVFGGKGNRNRNHDTHHRLPVLLLMLYHVKLFASNSNRPPRSLSISLNNRLSARAHKTIGMWGEILKSAFGAD